MCYTSSPVNFSPSRTLFLHWEKKFFSYYEQNDHNKSLEFCSLHVGSLGLVTDPIEGICFSVLSTAGAS